MPSVEELLNQDSEDEYINISPINDIITIDPETRTINLPASETLFGTEQEMNVERKYFKCPKIVGDNIDLSKHQIYITYVTAKDNTGTFLPEEELGLYYCEDMAVDGDYITFSWLLSGNVLRNHGFIAFAVSAKHMDGEVLKTRWKTKPAVGTVLLTVPDGEAIVERYPDIITQLLDKMNAVEKIATPEAMQNYVDAYFGRNPVQPVQLDSTLTDNTKAAPAGMVGELKGDLTYYIGNYNGKILKYKTGDGFYSASNTYNDSTNYFYADLLFDDTITISGCNDACIANVLDSEKNLVRNVVNWGTLNRTYRPADGDKYLRVSIYIGDIETASVHSSNSLVNNVINDVTQIKNEIADVNRHLRQFDSDKVDISEISFNIWNEKTKVVDGNHIENEEPIPVKPNTEYYFRSPIKPLNGLRFLNKDLDIIKTIYEKGVFTTPSECVCITFGIDDSYGTTYNNDICINESQPNDTFSPHNGQYVPYGAKFIYDDVQNLKSKLYNGNVCPISDEVYEDNGVTITPQHDGTYIINGTTTNNVVYYIYDVSWKLPKGIFPGNTYRIGVSPVGEFSYTITFMFYTPSGIVSKSGQILKITCPDNATGMGLQLKLNAGKRFDNKKISLFIEDYEGFEHIKNVMNIDDMPKPMISFIDDDGNKNFYTYLLPLIRSKHVPMATAVITKNITSPVSWMMNGDELKEVYLAGGEVLSHTHNHFTYDDIIDSNGNRIISRGEQIEEYILSKRIINSLGIECKGLVYSGSSTDVEDSDECIKMAGFDYAFINGGECEYKSRISRYRIRRWTATTPDEISLSLAEFKAMIDSLSNSGSGWLIINTHTSYTEWNSADRANEIVQILSDTIDYARSLGIDIVSTEGATKYYLN